MAGEGLRAAGLKHSRADHGCNACSGSRSLTARSHTMCFNISVNHRRGPWLARWNMLPFKEALCPLRHEAPDVTTGETKSSKVIFRVNSFKSVANLRGYLPVDEKSATFFTFQRDWCVRVVLFLQICEELCHAAARPSAPLHK